MSLEALTSIWRSPPCRGGDLLCLLAIADNADDHGYAWPSIETIARKAAMSERGAQKCLRKLQDAGLIFVEIGGGRGKSNAYQITTNGMGEWLQHKNPEQNSPNRVHPLQNQNPEQSDINPEQSCNKPRTPVHPNPIEPSLEQTDDERAHSHDHSIDPQQDGTPTVREQILAAIGVDPVSGMSGPNGNVLGAMADMQELFRWQNDLGLTLAEVVSVVGDVMRRKSGGPPVRFSYFTKAMQEFAGRREQKKLEPIVGTPPDTHPLPKNWTPSEADLQAAYALDLNDADIKEIANDFYSYWTERAHTTGHKSQSGWEQAWRQRCRDVAPGFIRNRGVAGRAVSGRHGQGGGLAGAVARRQFGGQI